jgi:hypothetical protein
MNHIKISIHKELNKRNGIITIYDNNNNIQSSYDIQNRENKNILETKKIPEVDPTKPKLILNRIKSSKPVISELNDYESFVIPHELFKTLISLEAISGKRSLCHIYFKPGCDILLLQCTIGNCGVYNIYITRHK